ncbi:hypothetical protein M441DRAFT_229419 [Trichoderma asperellum CBS 433.97]|uniref:Uncharacterized protein n=1 Tax=Trichoderma asperellum (strain ATCC 204424 / CBS 433.97 / NBRC 101777) TaxID=1042311 RepID=A0A2T3ZQG1_TRIA4|nr:hypothetical protein M441DRAFT_229419 [Trichoderma asperellum CBS 433.97]PTB47029.1 hypothetical protein M441DRAFT_229419 [Trichoderma asperellum CBS 433.97]
MRCVIIERSSVESGSFGVLALALNVSMLPGTCVVCEAGNSSWFLLVSTDPVPCKHLCALVTGPRGSSGLIHAC